jgi:hypothetical protein
MTTTTLTRNADRITLTIEEGSSFATVLDTFGNDYDLPLDEARPYIRHRLAEGWVAS